jgi:hypothetical protein
MIRSSFARLLGLLACLAGSALSAADPYAANHRYSTDPTQQISLVAQGVAQAEIVVASDAGLVAAFAAEEMQKLLQACTGAELPIVAKASGTRAAIHLGGTALAAANGIDVATLPRDGFVIKSVGNRIFIAGRDDKEREPKRGMYVWGALYHRGTLFGAYDFLERFAGVRFFFPGEMGTVTPKQPDLSVPAMDIYEAPDFDQRGLRFNGTTQLPDGTRLTDERWTWTLMNLRWRYGTNYIPCCHGLTRRGYLARFGKSNPEYFAILANGKRDSDPNIHGHRGHVDYLNKGFLNEVYLDAEAYLTGKPASLRGVRTLRGANAYDLSSHQPGYFDLCPQDGLSEANWDHSPHSWPYWEQGRQSDLIWGYVSKIATRLKQNKIPGYVTCFAYSCYRDVPSDTVDIPDNVLVQVCLRGPWSDPVPELRRRNDELIKAWNRKIKTGKVWLWNYMHDNNGHTPKGVPPVSTRLIANYYGRLAPHIRGARSQGGNYYLLFNYLNNYVFYKVAWNTQTDVEALMRDHNEKLFGPAAGKMGVFFDRIEDIWTKQALGEVRETALGPSPVAKTDEEVWTKIYTEEVMAELSALVGEAHQLAEADQPAQERVAFFQEKFLGEIGRQRAVYFDRVGTVRDLVHEVALRPAAQPIIVDGNLDEPVWTAAKPVYLVPTDGGDPRVRTAVRAVWDADMLYLSYECEEPRPQDLIINTKTNDDLAMWRDAAVEFFLNPANDRTNYYHLIVNAGGYVSDSKVSRRGAKLAKEDIDRAWQSDAIVKTRVLKDRWVAEIALPVKSLGAVSLSSGATWVANMNRSRNVATEDKADIQFMSWSPFLRKSFHDLGRFGSLRFVTAPTDPTKAIMRNGSFETAKANGQPEHWYFPGDLPPEGKAGAFLDTTTYREGKHSVRIVNDTQRRVIVAQVGLPGKEGQLETGKKYRLSFFIKGENIVLLDGGNPKFHGAYANVFSHRNIFFPPTKKYTGTFGWKKVAFEFTSMPPLKGATKIPPDYLRLGLQDASGTVWFDDVRIEEVE